MKMLVVVFTPALAVLGGAVSVSAVSNTHVAACPMSSVGLEVEAYGQS
jgi:hypothetical protein